MLGIMPARAAHTAAAPTGGKNKEATMALKVQKVDVWAGELQDQPGGLARALSAVANAGGSVECVIARRDPSRPGMGELFITPVRGAKVQSAVSTRPVLGWGGGDALLGLPCLIATFLNRLTLSRTVSAGMAKPMP